MLLASLGIYGVFSYLVSRRTREIGVRVALGAQRGRVLRGVVGDAMKVALAGISAGLVATLGLARLLSSQLYGVSAHDPQTLAAVAAILLIVAVAASFVPARRAMCVDPTVALRHE
jgi:putative ABC transport system permease protein